MDMSYEKIIETLRFDMEMTLFDSNTGEVFSEESLKWRRDEATYEHYIAEKDALELIKEYQKSKEKLVSFIRDIKSIKRDNDKDLATIRHKIRTNGVLDNGLSDAEESFEAGYGSAIEYILGKLRSMME